MIGWPTGEPTQTMQLTVRWCGVLGRSPPYEIAGRPGSVGAAGRSRTTGDGGDWHTNWHTEILVPLAVPSSSLPSGRWEVAAVRPQSATYATGSRSRPTPLRRVEPTAVRVPTQCPAGRRVGVRVPPRTQRVICVPPPYGRLGRQPGDGRRTTGASPGRSPVAPPAPAVRRRRPEATRSPAGLSGSPVRQPPNSTAAR
jgi:hypothetical protein